MKRSLSDVLKEDATIGELRRHIGKLEKALQKAKNKESVIIEAVVEAVLSAPPKIVVPPMPKLSQKRRSEIAILHLSDLQIGKVTETYNTSVAEERILEACRRTALITDIRRSAASIDELHVYLGGDVVEGEDIFPGQPHQIDFSVYDQACIHGPRMISKALLYLLEQFRTVKVLTVAGNHGRNGPRGTRANPRTNWDQVLYRVLEALLLGRSDDPRSDLAPRLSMQIPERFWIVDRVYGWGNLLVHGHQIRGGFAGFPWYGTAKKAWGWIDAIPEPWDHLFFGHFHTPAMMTIGNRRCYANGSTESDNEYAREELAAAGEPCQRLCFMDEEHGIIADSLLYLGRK